ncbi:30S ribosomal protein S4 [Mesomycoplasma neurolyticum]|uniref:Small ribosomal subunit protein uS4 n=1 Tax=Mesomycoplasma neurolyticum TaxID=2120 RepID=A0A449A5V8_9BACT|nr:30S ribosomal protein S4 [Mesomycoplasma neurolyticum]VEU59641.1 30S ribosomal protein S4 [Mesomycoplasma neurolyticum]
MARYTGPIFKKSKKLNFSILESGKEFAKNTRASADQVKRRAKISDYGQHLQEKQKVRFMYGVNERQFKNTFFKASKRKGVVGTNFLQMLETRLDNLVYRAGFALTRRQARQLVNHNHFLVNGKKANIPSMQISVGSVIELKEKSRKNVQILESLEKRVKAEWMEYKDFTSTLKRLPERSELNQEINETFIVEFYNK